MMRYSVQHRYGIFVKVYKFFSFAKNNRKNLSGKYTPVMLAARQKLLIMLKKYATDALKTSPKRWFLIATGDFIGNKIADRVRKFSKNSKQNHSEKVTIEYDKEIPKEKYISLK